MTQVPHALNFAGYTYDKHLLTNLFGGEDRVGRRTVKKLRDALTHSMSKSAVEELRSGRRRFCCLHERAERESKKSKKDNKLHGC